MATRKPKSPKPATKTMANPLPKAIQNAPAEIQNEHRRSIDNGLTEAILGFDPGVPGGSVQLSQVDTLFRNQRWYLISNMRQILSEMYVELGLIQTVVDVPVNDGFRGGIDIDTKQLDEDEIRKLIAEMDRAGDLTIAAQAQKWNRLYGGAGILIMTDQDPESPLDIEAIQPGSPLEFRAVDMWELFWDKQNAEGYDPEVQEQDYEFYNYYAKKIHKSRVLKLKGLIPPSFIRPRLRGWGFSIVESVIRSINQYLKATDLTFEVLDEFKLDIFKIKNLTSTLLSAQGTDTVKKRIQLANFQKNYQNALTMDAEDDYIQKELSFAGVAETMTGIRMQVASDLRMPLTKVFGISAAGFSSGEDDIENYNAMVESDVRQKIKYDVLKMVQLRCQHMFGSIPDDLEISFQPLRMLSAEQEETVKTNQFNRVLAAKTAGLINDLEFREACNKDNLLPMQLDVENIVLDQNTAEEDSGVEPGAQKEESRKPQLKGAAAKKSTIVAKEPPAAKNALEDFDGPQIVVVGLKCGKEILTGKRKDNGLWAFPGGHRDRFENIRMAACREVYEESGITVLPSQLEELPAKRIRSPRTGKDFVVFPFMANVKKQMPKVMSDPDCEFSVMNWVPIDASTHELQPQNRHAKEDLIVQHLLGPVKNEAYWDDSYFSLPFEVGQFMQLSDEVKNEFAAIKNPGKVDEGLWKKAKRASQHAFGEEKWAFITWWYKEHGGRFG